MKNREIKMPDTLVILFGVVLFVYIISFIVPAGKFDTQKVSYVTNTGVTKTRSALVASSYQVQKDDTGKTITSPPALFAQDGEHGFLNFVYDGITTGSRDGGPVAIIAFILIIGGAFGIIMRTGVVEAGMLKLIAKMHKRQILLLPLMSLIFSIGGAVFGMGEEAIAFALLLAPLMVAMGYDSLVGVMVTYLSSQIGFATSWMNPFSVAVAQGVAGIPVLSGASFRIVMWATFTLSMMCYSVFYARSLAKNPKKSINYESDEYWRGQLAHIDTKRHFGLSSILILLTLLGGMVWVVYGVVEKSYYIPEIATQFFTMGLVIGVIAVISKTEGMNVNEMAKSFKKGASDILPAALVVGMANGIILMMGGTDPTHYTMLNTVLHASANLVGDLHKTISAITMFLFQAMLNIFVTSGSGQAALTMPLMAPLSDLVGVSRQIAVLAFQLGDGWTHCIMPTSGPLMATLAVSRVDYTIWVKFIFKFYAYLMLLSMVFVVIAVLINYQ